MYKMVFVVAFVLTVITYAVDYAWAPQDPRDAGSVLIVFIFWFAVSILVCWLWRGQSKARKQP